MGEKTEQATPKKLRDARKKGQVAKSQDFPSVFTFITSVSVVLALAPSLYDQLGGFLVGIFSAVSIDNLDKALIGFFGEAVYMIFSASMFPLVVTVVIGVIVNFLVVGPTFAVEAFKPDLKKFDPIQNLKAKFKMKTLVELLKSMLKITIAGYVIYGVVVKSLSVLTTAVSQPILGALQLLYYFLFEVLFKIGLIFFVIAVLDLLYQRFTFANEMKMEKFEVKQEYKNTEGDPQIKGKRKEIAREIAYADGPMENVKKAKAIVTNPTHLAIAIGYDKELDPAPYVLEMGEGRFAGQIVEFAEELNIPVVRNIPLAHKLWEEGELWTYVPQDTYEPLAEILRWIASLEEGIDQPPPEFD